jgi:hypothetical protein
VLKRLLNLLPFLLEIGSASAQDAAWTTLMYDAFHCHLVRVNSDGDVLQDLTLPVASEDYVRNIAVSPSGTLLAYVSGAFQFVIYDSAAQAERAVIELPSIVTNSISMNPRGDIFNEDETLVTVAYTLDDGHWQLYVYDVTTGNTQYTLRDDNAAMPQFLGEYEFPLGPIIQRFDESRIVFTVSVLTADGDWRYANFQWEYAIDAVMFNLAYNSLDNDTFTPTGEVVSPLEDDPQHNALQAFSDFYIYPFFNAQDAALSSPRFVQNGERIAVNSATTSNVASILLLERDGTIVDQLETIYISNVFGLNDGFVYAMNTPSATQNTTLLYYVKTRDDTLDDSKLIWSGESGPSYDLIWARDLQQAPLAEFTPWGALTGPFYVGQE